MILDTGDQIDTHHTTAEATMIQTGSWMVLTVSRIVWTPMTMMIILITKEEVKALSIAIP